MLEFTKQQHLIVSGGQTGADLAGLEAARTLGYSTGGWAPSGWTTMMGPQKELLEAYGLKEHKGGYRPRTIANVKNSDITLIVSRKWNSPGTILTINSCVRLNKPYIAMHEDGKIYKTSYKFKKSELDEMNVVEKLTDAYAEILRTKIIINCAGNAEENAPGITDSSYNLFYTLFNKMY